MKHLFNKRAVTLIELIISLAIIGIVLVSMLTMFSSGFINITRAGQRTEATFNNQGTIENVLNSTNSNIGDDDIVISFSDSSTINAKGTVKSETETLSIGEVEFYFFHPQY